MNDDDSDEINLAETLAWIAWRTDAAVAYFGGPNGGRRWLAARNGVWPDELGQPKVTPVAAEVELWAALANGLPYRLVEERP